ncbi:MAG: hypothetical protein FWD64_13095, partial [Acidobacteriaceae bacterium]|nr:hypothetical protein [Acidobacteriaceae bacterium]
PITVTGNGKTDPVVTWAAPAAITVGTALGSAQLNATANVDGTFAYTPAAGTVMNTSGTMLLSVTFTPADTANYNTVTKTAALSVKALALAPVTWTAPASIVYGTALSATQLNAKATIAGTFVYTPAAGAVLPGGSNTLSAVFTPADTSTYATRTVTQILKVTQAKPAIVWTTPATTTVGTALSAAQLNATANTPGTFTYTPAAGTVLSTIGTQTLSVTFTPDDAVDYTTATATVTLTVKGAGVDPVITWATPAAVGTGTALSAAQLNATANVPGRFEYSPAAGTVMSKTGAQMLSVTFIPADSASYNTVMATVSLTVKTLSLAPVTWAAPASIVYGTALSATQLNAKATIAGTFEYTPVAGTVLPVGTQTLSAVFTPADTSTYATRTVTQILKVTPVTPVITWATPAVITVGTALSATQLNATANVGGTFVYTPAIGTVMSTAGTTMLSVTFTPADTATYSTVTKTVALTTRAQ